MIPVRSNGLPVLATPRQFTLSDRPDGVLGLVCPACDHRFRVGDRIALILIGPGDDPNDVIKARESRWHTGAAVAVHAFCTGYEWTSEGELMEGPSAD